MSEESRYVIVKVKMEGDNHFFAIPMSELTVWEVGQRPDDPYQLLPLMEPHIGRNIDISINATYPLHIKVFAIQNTSNGFRILRRAGYCGLDEVIHNFSTGKLDEVIHNFSTGNWMHL